MYVESGYNYKIYFSVDQNSLLCYKTKMTNHQFEEDFEIILSNCSSHEFGKQFGTIINFSVFPRKNHEQLQTRRIAFCIALLVMLETIGNFLLYSMIFYEKYGMDPQKRTLTNQLFSTLLIVQILQNIFITPFTVVNYIYEFPSKFYN